MADEYEGWTNRETWATNLWLANDEGLYLSTLEQAAECIAAEEVELGGDLTALRSSAAYKLAEVLQDEFAEWEGEVIAGEATPGLAGMILDIGSLYRVDWYEIAEHWVDDAREQEEAS